MAAEQAKEGGRGTLLTRLQAAGLIKNNDKIVYRGSEGQEYEGTITLGDENVVFVKHGGDLLKNEAAFVRKATGDAAIPKNFKNALTIGGRAFRDISDEYKKQNPRPERPAPAAAASSGSSAPRAASGARRTRRPTVRLGQLVHSGALAAGSEAWFESKAGRIVGSLVERDRRVGFQWNDEFYPTPAAFIRAAEENRGVAEDDRVKGKWDQTLHVGDQTVREAREKYLAERPPPEPKPAAAAAAPSAGGASTSALQQQLDKVRAEIKKLQDREADILAKLGSDAPRARGRGRGRGPRRGRRAPKGEEGERTPQ